MTDIDNWDCKHENLESDYEYDLYVCADCETVIAGSPNQDREDARAEYQTENFA